MPLEHLGFVLPLFPVSAGPQRPIVNVGGMVHDGESPVLKLFPTARGGLQLMGNRLGKIQQLFPIRTVLPFWISMAI